jgi:hypothetical protein
MATLTTGVAGRMGRGLSRIERIFADLIGDNPRDPCSSAFYLIGFDYTFRLNFASGPKFSSTPTSMSEARK